MITTYRTIPHRPPACLRPDERWAPLLVAASLLVAACLWAAPAAAQVAPTPLTLAEARTIARRVSPDLRAAREAVTAAEARARQAGAFPNPTLAYSHERTSRDGATNAQHVAALEQPLDFLGQRAARRDAASLRTAAARARFDLARTELDFAVTRAFAHALAAERQAALASRMADAFGEARRVSGARLAAGDVSGYADRRLRLEAARYAALAAAAMLARDSARVTLATLLADSAGGLPPLAATALVLDARALDSLAAAPLPPPPAAPGVAADSLQVLALARRAELRVAQLERDAAAAGIRLARSERLPIPVVSAGLKTERTPDGDGFRGLVAGVTLPLPLWDRREGAVAAAEADARVLDAELAALRLRVAREVATALAASQAVEAQLAALGPRVTEDTETALRAVRVAYDEGEITLVEWLDAVRAYQDAQAAVTALQAESLIRRAALERAVGAPLSED